MNLVEPQDWHRADIKAALAKKGWTLGSIAREYGYARTSPPVVLRRPWLRMEAILAELLGVAPWDIWPSRYAEESDGNRRRSAQRRLGSDPRRAA